MNYLRLNRYLLTGGLAIALLSGCGSGGGGTSGNQDSGSLNELPLSFQPDSTVTSSGKDVLFLSLNRSESGNDLMVLDINGKTLDTALASGISADIRFDPAEMDYAGFEADNDGAGTGMAAPMETDHGIVIIGFHKLIRPAGRMGKIKFRFRPGVPSGTVSFTPALRYIGTSGNLLSSPSLTGQGGTIILHN